MTSAENMRRIRDCVKINAWLATAGRPAPDELTSPKASGYQVVADLATHPGPVGDNFRVCPGVLRPGAGRTLKPDGVCPLRY